MSFATLPSTCGSITLDGATPSNGGSADLPAGTDSVSATACLYYELQSLVGAESVTIHGSTANVSDAGTVTATFAHASCTVDFATSPTACGLITFNGSVYPDGASMEVRGGIYAVSAKACAGVSLQDFFSTGSGVLASALADVSGPGAIMANFAPSTYPVSCTTTPGTCGSIRFNGTTSTNGQVASVAAGIYSVSFQACGDYALQSMVGSGGVTARAGLVPVAGPGSLVATFAKQSPSVAGFLGLSGNVGYYVVGGTVAAAMAALVVVALTRGTQHRPGRVSLPPRPEDPLTPPRLPWGVFARIAKRPSDGLGRAGRIRPTRAMKRDGSRAWGAGR